MHERLENTVALVEKSKISWDLAYGRIFSSGLALDRPYTALLGSTLDELNGRLNSTFLLADELRSVDDGGTALLLPRLLNINGPLTQIAQHSDSIVSLFQSYLDATYADPAANLQLQVLRAGTAVASMSLSPALDSISAQQTALVDQLTLGLRFGRSRGSGLFQQRAKDLQLSGVELEKVLVESRSSSEELGRVLQGAKTSGDQLTAQLAAASESRTKIDATFGEVKTVATEIELKLAKITELTVLSDSLSKQVQGYAASFAAFKEDLDAKVAAQQKFEKDATAAMVANGQRESGIDSLISKADAMIRGATTAGLSKSLDEAKLEYEKRLSRTGWWFLGSVVVLLVCLLPIAGQLIPGPWQVFFKPVPGANTDPWLAALGKVIFLLPATWATAFFASNYSELFHLSREYAHKAALAKSVDGFKREAPEYREEIVAGVFMEIQENPGSRKSPSAATPQNPIAKRILETLLDAIKNKIVVEKPKA